MESDDHKLNQGNEGSGIGVSEKGESVPEDRKNPTSDQCSEQTDSTKLNNPEPSTKKTSIDEKSSEDTSKDPKLKCNKNTTSEEAVVAAAAAKDKSNGTNNDTDSDRSKYVHYEGDVAVYTDPQSRQQYTWDNEKNEWKLRQIDYEFDGSNYFYKDKTGTKYKWDTASNSWVPSVPLVTSDKAADSSDEEEYDENNAQKTAPPIQRQDMSKGSYGYEGDTHTYTDSTDGTVYIWDKEKNAWFPKVDDDFLARYQMSYGFIEQPNTVDEKKPSADLVQSKVEEKSVDATAPMENPKAEEKVVPGQKRKPEPPKWFDIGEESTKVYVSNLPLDLTQEEFVEVMQKCGLVMKDVDTNQMKIKLYTDPYTKDFKGDALCTYIKKESVDLALSILDGYEIRGKKIKVERAKFTMKGEAYDPKLKPKKKRKKDLEKLKKAQEKLFDWRPDKMRGERSKNESVIIVKNLFDPALFDKDVTLILEYQQDLREECSKCGHVKKVVLHDKHPEGVAQIFFKEPEAADACRELLNGRWFGQRQITAETWDGKTRYKIQETAEEREARLKKWETFLEEEDKKKKEAGKGSIDEKESKELQGESKESIGEKESGKELQGESKESIGQKESGNELQGESKQSMGKEKNGGSEGKESPSKKTGEEEKMEEDGDNSDATRSSGESEGEE
ncbi:HIV Tat-specific factor 1 homolog isoform X2 [Diaphorina citri]|uniref:17S U2 SnRNP complex component HTATSF1 n=1 Tax=Diaphorina citri TaxID=121845 RepID=A0A1S4ESR1_DIACI|nr:HIV Tat-specific factor 1 homolog isoform X1 [Diaphorina citri]XP_017305218.1 HIV Tat-specific factor 1 homolog isoform X2 [Diaphorina citri]